MRKAISRLSGLIAADVAADVKTVAREAWFARRRPTTMCTLDGVVLELGPWTPPSLRSAVYLRCYEQRERRVSQSTLRADDTVLELGAGMGFITTIAARIAREVRSYEADPEMARATAGPAWTFPPLTSLRPARAPAT